MLSCLGISLQRSHYVDYPIPTRRGRLTLIAKIPEGIPPNMWVYVEVFGVYQWVIFIILLVLMAMELSVIIAKGNDLAGSEFGSKRGSKINSASSALSMACLYAIQMGSHTNSKKFTTRLLTLTMSVLTMLFFVFYTGDITAQMTSSPSGYPIRTFEDVILHNYKVIAHSSYYKNKLASSKPGSAKVEVHNNHFEMKANWYDALDAVINDPE